MSRFNISGHRAKPAVAMTTSPIASASKTPDTRTFEGAPGWTMTPQAELFRLATGTLLDGKGSFYESGAQQDERLRDLTATVALNDPQWALDFATWLRGPGNIRTGAIMFAVEAVKARLNEQTLLGDHAAIEIRSTAGINRRIIDAVCQRPDEPGELLAYWTSQYGRRIPKPVKRGLADAVRRLYSERSLLKYDTASKGYRFGDVLELTHPSPDPGKPNQGTLFKFAIDRRHNRISGTQDIPSTLVTVMRNAAIREHGELEHWLNPDVLRDAGMTWEDAFSAVGSKVDKAKLWEALIPSMGIMALIRNLRNFDQAGVSDTVAAQVIAKLVDSNVIAKSRQFPFRFLAAYRATNEAGSLRWAYPLEQALNLSLDNVPSLGGRTLILVDRSPSMFPGWGYAGNTKSDISLADQAAIFGCALALRAAAPTLVWFGGESREIPVPKGKSVLKLIEDLGRSDGTDIPSAIKRHYKNHDRVVVVTDEQTRPGYFPSNMRNYGGMGETSIDALVPLDVPVFMWNLAGYKPSAMPSGSNARFALGGLTDKAFTLIPLLEAGAVGAWPWQIQQGG